MWSRVSTPRAGRASLTLLVVGVLAGCTDERIVYRDREPFNPPADASAGFLGYFRTSTKLTACGNCHVGTQRDWKTTRHADAWASLPATAALTCQGCHTVSDRGNATTGNVGYLAIPDTSYHDVQCESCHGPGFQHVTEPDDPARWPYARAHVTDATASCASCHTGSHQPFVDEWSTSRHSQIITSAASRAECASCHDGKATLVAWGETSNYVEKTQTGAFPVTCAVCHDPHGSENTADLRFSIVSPDPERNLCMKCHMRRVEPAGGSSQGTRPHAPQGAVLLGTAGYRPAGFTYDTARILTSHASEANPKLCAGCHLNRFEVTDPQSGNFIFQASGHLFRPIPCLDAQGRPMADNSCAYTTTARTFRACATSGCHATEAIAAQRLLGIRADIALLADQIWQDLDGDETIDATPVDAGYLPTVRAATPGEFTTDATITAAEGAEFNIRTVGEGRYANGDKSLGVHNPYLATALLSANIVELRARYGLPAPPANVEALIEQSLQRVRTRQPDLFPASKR